LLRLPLGLALLGQALLRLALLGLLGELRLVDALLRGVQLGGALLSLLLGSLLVECGAGPIPRHADSPLGQFQRARMASPGKHP
jgi:hypothetical protein